MKKYYISFLLLCSIKAGSAYAQIIDSLTSHSPLADQILHQDYKPVEVMLLATWHFSYVNADSHKTKEENKVDLNAPKRQKEILEVVDRLNQFNPTIVCIEGQGKMYWDSLYQAYLNGSYTLSINEREQLGFRVSKAQKLNKIHAVDTYSWLRDHYDKVTQLHDLWNEEYYLDTLSMQLWTDKYWKWYDLNNTYPLKYTVDEALKIDNHPTNLKRLIGNYLIQMKTVNHNGPDAYSLKIYNRNVRIFNNILKTNPKENDRILVIMGGTHIAFLTHLFDASPEFTLVSPYNYKTK